MKRIPKIIKKNNREYILKKVYNNYALYCDWEFGYKECFSFHELGLIEKREESRQANLGGYIKI